MTSSYMFNDRREPARGRRDDVARWLALYPAIGAEGRRAILTYLKQGRSLDFHQLMCDERIASNLGKFVDDHRAELAPDWYQIAAMAAVAGAVLLFVLGS